MSELTASTGNIVTYSGSVVVTLNTKGHRSPFILKNSGQRHLMDTIARALAGYPINGSTPRYVDIQHSEDGVNFETVLRNRVPFTGIVYGVAAGADANLDESRLLMNATITYEDKQPLNALKAHSRLAMLDSNLRPLATIDASIGELWKQITESSDAFIEWTLKFENQ